MKVRSKLDLLKKTMSKLPIGIGIFEVEDLDELKSIRYVFMNDVILHEMRKTKEEVNGKYIVDVAPEAFEHPGGIAAMEAYQKVARDHQSINLGLVEYSNQMTAGTYELTVNHIEANFVYVMLRNVTELEQKNKELEQFAYIASHDLQEPLRTMNNFVGLIKKKYQGKIDKDADGYLNFISEASSRMINLIKGLLEHGRIGHTQEKKKVDANELVELILKDLDSVIKESGARIKSDQLPTLRGDRIQLRLLFQNLITNAIKFRKADTTPKVDISVRQDQQLGYVFAVKDNGIGIDEKNQEQIFEIFERLHSRNEYQGNGLGLAHCKKIVGLHQGKIWVESTVGGGSTFFFNIPE